MISYTANDTFLWLIGSRIGMGESCHELAIHGEMPKQLVGPIDIGVGIALLLITECQLTEGLVREAVLRNQLQQFGCLAKIATTVTAVGQLSAHLISVSQRESPLVILLGLEGIILLHQAVALLDVYLERVQTLAPGGGDRHKGEDEHSE